MSGETLDRSVGRRTVLGGAAVVAAGAAVSACAAPAATDTQAAPTAKATAIGGAAPPAPTTATAGGVGKETDVPVGGGKIFNGAVVVTQPAAGTFKAFSATCTHQGCTVAEVTASGIACPCHGSVFSINDGSVVNGPATKPLTPMKVTADNSGTLVVS